ncbi:hypothetical protein CSC33_5009 [Pseudomonas aeruginosa]|nr:hypothetical protein CSC33_5009 [Pseudomonas aeruginosa]
MGLWPSLEGSGFNSPGAIADTLLRDQNQQAAKSRTSVRIIVELPPRQP